MKIQSIQAGFGALLAAALLTGGCASGPGTPSYANTQEKGRQGTIAYYVEIECEPGVRIEADNEYVGMTPLKIKIWGDRDGTFHNFGSETYVVKALASKPGQFTQTKVFRTGGWFSPEDRIPGKIFFDMNQK